MNVHPLELFYHVARHGGIMPAVRNIPYGIQPPVEDPVVGNGLNVLKLRAQRLG